MKIFRLWLVVALLNLPISMPRLRGPCPLEQQGDRVGLPVC